MSASALHGQGPDGHTLAEPDSSHAPALPDWVIDRPSERNEVVKALRGALGTAVGITTSLPGAGGFGKTTLAQAVCADPRVRKRFEDRVYQLTVGRDTQGPAAIAGKVNEAVELITGQRSSLIDPATAGARLGQALDEGLPTLLVLDDVWDPDQLAPFLLGGIGCARLVTTRIPQALPNHVDTVAVDRMSAAQAKELLTWQLPALARSTTQLLLDLTGGWPLLLRMCNAALRDASRPGQDVGAQALALSLRLGASGSRQIDVSVTDERTRAVRSVVEASLLRTGNPGDRDRFLELCVFAGDQLVPMSLVQRLWAATAGLDAPDGERICRALDELCLLSLSEQDGVWSLGLHDVIRTSLRAELGIANLRSLNRTLLDLLTRDVTMAQSLMDGSASPAWWELPDSERYLWDHLAYHLAETGQPGEVNSVVTDLRWVAARLRRHGPVATAVDLARGTTGRSMSLVRGLSRAAHLLEPTQPAHSVVDVLHSRLGEDPAFAREIGAVQATTTWPHLIRRWPFPDTPDPALWRVLPGHTGAVGAVAIAPDGRWLVSAGEDRTLRVWDVTAATVVATLAGHHGGVYAVAVAPDGRWVASASDDGTVRIWDVAAATLSANLLGHHGAVLSVAIAPGGRWLVSGGRDSTIKIWEVGSTKPQATLAGHNGPVAAVAISPDGTWLASASHDGSVRIWDVATGSTRARLTGHAGAVLAVAISPDGAWLASTGDHTDRTVRIWRLARRAEGTILAGHTGGVLAVAISPDGRWLASSGNDRTVRIWSLSTAMLATTLTGHTGPVPSIAIAPDGTWLTSAGGFQDRTVRLWDITAAKAAGSPRQADDVLSVSVCADGTWLATAGLSKDRAIQVWHVASGSVIATIVDHSGAALAVAVSPDGRWLASGSNDNTVQIWDVRTAVQRTRLTGHSGAVWAVAISPDGTWLASASDDRTIRIWDTRTAKTRATLTGHTGPVWSVAISPDGAWLASASQDQTVRVWDARSGKMTAKLAGHVGDVRSVAIAAGGTWVASAGSDQTVRLWDVAAAAQLCTLTGHTDEVRCVAASADGNLLASTGDDKTVRVWDRAGQECLAMMRVDGGLSSVAWLGDSPAVVLGGGKGVYLFEFSKGVTDEERASARHRAI